jgi:hypothetical protein
LRVVDFGAVHLRDRCRGHRRPEAREGLAQRVAERGGHRHFRLALRKRRHLVLEAFEIAGDCHADHIGPRCQELPEFDVGRTEAGERCRKPNGCALAARPLDQPRTAHGRPRRQRQFVRVDERQHALAREHHAGAAETDGMGNGGDHEDACRAGGRIPPLKGEGGRARSARPGGVHATNAGVWGKNPRPTLPRFAGEGLNKLKITGASPSAARRCHPT